MNLVSKLKNKKSLNIIYENNNINSNSLLQIIEYNTIILKKLAIKKKDTIALVLENGPEFITSFLSCINSTVAAPLNPNYTASEFDFYFKDLKPKALITNLPSNHSSIKTSYKNKVKIIRLEDFLFKVDKKNFKNNKIKNTVANLNDTALILHTSGTTSRPKMVALTHQNIISSSLNISNALNLKKTDKNIILMPSFHIHGIIASILAPLYSGGSVVALPKFNVLTFYSFLEKHKPTWFTAVPTMLQSILDRSKNNKKVIQNSKLRFIRSSSASLPSNVFKSLESTFKVPVIESYGMTEAAHQMTSNLLPPKKRKINSVGKPIGLQVKIIDQSNKFLSYKKEGEVLIKGKNVLNGYLANSKANKESFFNGWFRTGDLGYFDKDGYLYISGRIKEIINRGGEKISPKEVDEVFMKHSKVSKAISFSVKHPKLGEDISLAVVLKNKKSCKPNELKDFAQNQLARFKIPKNIYIVDEIPVGATGKIQRIGLAKKLGIE